MHDECMTWHCKTIMYDTSGCLVLLRGRGHERFRSVDMFCRGQPRIANLALPPRMALHELLPTLRMNDHTA